MDIALSTITEQIRSAIADQRALRIRGGGSKDFYGERLQGELLDTRVLQGVVSYEPSELVVTVRAGTALTELEQLLAARDQYLPFEPPHFAAGATVGGMVAAGLSGPARAASGGVRDFVLGVQMLNGRAQLLQFGGQVIKNVAGYDVSRLMVGALGTLGVITEVSLKVLPQPLAEATLRFDLDQPTALRRLNAWAGKPLPVNASCWLREPDQPRLYLRLRGAHAAVHSARRDLGGEVQDEAAAQAFWQALREHRAAFFADDASSCLWRLGVPDTSADLQLDGPTLVEWGGAQRWVRAAPTQAAALRARLAAVGGTATLFRRGAAAAASWPPVFHPQAPALQRIARELRKQFDPARIFNRPLPD